MKNKVDKGFELIYWNLSYRRKFIRTLWFTPLSVLLIIFMFLTGDKLFINRLMPILLALVYIWQLIYTYIKWKKRRSGIAFVNKFNL